MNFQCQRYKKPINIIVVNPLTPTSKLILVKLLSGYVFGIYQLIDLTLLVSENDVDTANDFKSELLSCAFSYTNSINVLGNIPSVLGGDVVCFISNIFNPADLDERQTKEQLDTLLSLMKIAEVLSWDSVRKTPIIMADSVVAIDVLFTFSRSMPYDVFFCPNFLTAIAQSVLIDHLKVKRTALNDVYVWAANDNEFHIEVERPMIVSDEVDNTHCTHDMGGRSIFKKFNYDSTQFSATWMRKEFIQKVASSAAKASFGCVYRAAEFAQTLRDIWIMRTGVVAGNVSQNIGVISDGSLDTIRGCPYVLPIMFSGNSWSISRNFEDNIYLKQEIKRINKTNKLQHENLVSLCKEVLETKK